MQSQNINLDPISISMKLSEVQPIMNYEQAKESKEIISLISQLAINKLKAASKEDKNKYYLLEKQQIQAAEKGLKILCDIEKRFFDHNSTQSF